MESASPQKLASYARMTRVRFRFVKNTAYESAGVHRHLLAEKSVVYDPSLGILNRIIRAFRGVTSVKQ